MTARALAITLLGVAACGRIDYELVAHDGGAAPRDTGTDAAHDGGHGDSGPPGTDAGLDGGADLDAAPPADAGPLGDFGPPEVVLGLRTDVDDDAPSLSQDMLEIFFDSNRAGGPGNSDIWRSTRPSVDAPWAPPELVSELSTASTETSPELSPDGLVMRFSSDRPGGMGLVDIYETTRASRSSPWATPPRILSGLNSASSDADATTTADGLTLVFSSSRMTSADVYRSTRPDLGAAWSAPAVIAPISTSGFDGAAYMLPSGNVIYFRRNTGVDTLERAVRAESGEIMASETVPLATPDVDDPWVSADERTLFYSARDTDGSISIFTATR